MSRRTRLSTADRQALLLEATCRVIASSGIRGLRVDAVAAEAEVSTTLLYYHFTSRAGLLAATMEFVDERAGGYTRAPDGLPGRARLEHQLTSEFQDTAQVRTNSAVWNEFRAAAVFDPSLRAAVDAASRTWRSTVVSLVAEGQQDGSVDPGVDPEPAAERLTVLVEGLSSRWLAELLTTARAHQHISAALELECPGP
ncbi:MAG: TetR family transcriptional regulator [Saccharopolyspora sp.]|uniref:TetR/AcrR family transcriptional regulator n=1 Tax=Saccharopolyspora TaxID=1835 RepID=UPI00190A1FB8|nr:MULTISPECIES: TetR family transcriptional regulator C-terminal domain-containing protein [unclassified Saccharopolyspora]MBK0870622.1 TetR family transcriptional regulator [Saccharopolyspora sp. HNM0986]MBQ6642388.1 TetR family transcriptional regulator [Saccharopolyspora sp.]